MRPHDVICQTAFCPFDVCHFYILCSCVNNFHVETGSGKQLMIVSGDTDTSAKW